MKKVVLVTPTLNMGGAEIMCENLANALASDGVNVIVVSLFGDKTVISHRLEEQKIKVVYLDKKSGLDLSMIGKLRRLFVKERPDAIHTHNNSILYAIPAAIFSGVKKRVHTVHSIATEELIKPTRVAAKIFYKFFGVIPVALSEAVQNTIIAEYNLPKKKIPIVFNGINLSKCIPKTDYSVKDKLKILHIGRFEKVKNHEMLVKAFKMFHDQYPNSILQLVGEGSERKNIECLVNELQLNDNVIFLGFQPNVYNYLHDADIFTLPSVYEGIPMTLIEAMGTGLPIVASNVGGIPDMLDNGVSAVLIEAKEENLFSAFVMLSNAEQKRIELGENAKRSSQAFSSVKMAIKYKEIYEKTSRYPNKH